MKGRLEPQFGQRSGLLVELLPPEPRVRHVLLHVVVVLVMLVMALRPGPEGHEEGRVADVPADSVDPRVSAERRVAAVVPCKDSGDRGEGYIIAINDDPRAKSLG